MKKVIIIGLVWPEPSSTGAGTRMLQLINLFKKQNYQIIFISAAEKSEYSYDLIKTGVIEQPITLNDSSFDSWISNENPDIVLFDRFMTEEQYGWRVSENCPKALKILDTEDLHCLRKVRQDLFKKDIPFTIPKLKSSDIAKREIASMYRCDLSLLISSYEMDILMNEFSIDSSILFHLPFLLNRNELLQKSPGFINRKDFICIGNFLHEPNYDAVLYLKQEIWPLIRKKLPQARLKVFGAYPSQKVMQLHNEKQGFMVFGRANNALEELSKCRVNLAPLRFGAGLKTKLLEGMLSGTPSVTTKIGAEGFRYKEWNGFVTNNPIDFANYSVQLHQDEQLWGTKQKNAEVLLEQFTVKNYKEDFFNRLLEIANKLENHRVSNFIGSMLQHHNQQSTKYMSKWIEEKNKNKPGSSS
ncbi:glycosyltransferase [Pseudofulvibacter geojedonensis]|uniref:Glycosyltransferase n=1 Tax=Pseudofulvibacter geojedonensis TaxID=1123758 RepID=A0ABW3I4S1_9FLAO